MSNVRHMDKMKRRTLDTNVHVVGSKTLEEKMLKLLNVDHDEGTHSQNVPPRMS